MAFVPVPKGIKIVLTFVIQGRIVNVTFGVETAAAVTPADLTQAAAIPVTWWGADMKNNFSVQTGLTQVQVYDLTTVSSPSPITPVSPNVFGTVGGVPINAQSSLVTSLRTGMRGRSFRGREYWPGLAQGELVDDVTINPSRAAAMSTSMVNLASLLGAGSLTLAVISRFSGVDPVTHRPIPRASGILTPVTANIVNTRLDTQRRRAYL